MKTYPCLRGLVATLSAFMATAAQAQNPVDSNTPNSSLQGLLSGLAHPLVEWDHLLFLLGAAALVAAARIPVGRCVQLLGVFAVSASIGTAVHASGVNLPWAGFGVAVSLVAMALALLRVTLGVPALLALAVGGGLCHGYAYGESIIGASASPTLAYAVGLLAMQAGLLCALHGGWARVIERSPVFRPSARRGLALLTGVTGVIGAWTVGLVA